MSQNKTRVPGQRPAKSDAFTGNSTSAPLTREYQPSAQQKEKSCTRTHITGMYTTPTQEQNLQEINTGSLPERHLVAILFSISNNGIPEMRPLYLGRNKVGRSADADITLNEETVSAEHAVIVVRHITTPSSRIVLSITDSNSSMGTFINDECIDFDTHVLEDRDKIRFGASYEFVVIKLDPENLGLRMAMDFKVSEAGQASANGHAHTQINSKPSMSPVLSGIGGDNAFNPYVPSKKKIDNTILV